MAEGRRVIKYMDIDDVARIEKGESIGGRLASLLSVDLEWSEANNFIVDLNDEKYADVSDDFIDTLLEVDKARFKDVTGMQRIPANKYQTTFKASPASEKPELAPDADSPKVTGGGSVTGGAGPRGGTRGGGSTTGGT